MKFKIGDKVEVIASGYGMGPEEVGNVYTIASCHDGSYYKTEEAQKDGTKLHIHWKTFALVEKEVPKNTHEEDNPNIKMITTFVPTWAKYMAMNSVGGWVVYSHIPFCGDKLWKKSEGKKLYIGKCDPNEIEVPWQETLHEI